MQGCLSYKEEVNKAMKAISVFTLPSDYDVPQIFLNLVNVKSEKFHQVTHVLRTTDEFIQALRAVLSNVKV